MQTQLLFIMKNVKFGNQRRYQGWFAQRYRLMCICGIVLLSCYYDWHAHDLVCGSLVLLHACMGVGECIRAHSVNKLVLFALFCVLVYRQVSVDSSQRHADSGSGAVYRSCVSSKQQAAAIRDGASMGVAGMDAHMLVSRFVFLSLPP